MNRKHCWGGGWSRAESTALEGSNRAGSTAGEGGGDEQEALLGRVAEQEALLGRGAEQEALQGKEVKMSRKHCWGRRGMAQSRKHCSGGEKQSRKRCRGRRWR